MAKIAGAIRIEGSQFKDEYGRTLMLRGVNLSGSSKIPWSAGQITAADFYRHREVTFVNRPFPLDEAAEHFSRLRHWGLTFLRFIVTWEAIEHAGPGQYDEAYLEYLYQIIDQARQHGIQLFIDPHQDAWSRFSGGDGAPGWTLEAVGFDLKALHASGAAVIHTLNDRPLRLQWITNYTRLAAATMFTLFFGGHDFAPQTRIAGEPVQDFLQRHYIDAFKRAALKLSKLSNVVGFGTMNEPSHGFIGVADLNINLDKIDFVDDLVAASDLIITKAGGLMVSEILARGTPMVIFEPLPGQEEWNADVVSGYGAGIQVRMPEMAALATLRLLNQPERLQAMREHAQDIGRPQAALDIAARILASLPEESPSSALDSETK